MTPAKVIIIAALIAAIPPTLAVAVTWALGRRTQLRRSLAVDAQLYQIHTLVNSRLTAALERIEVQTEEIRQLKEHVHRIIPN